jgi:hypothetical protein
VLTEKDVQWLLIGAVIAGDQPYAITLEYSPYPITQIQNSSHVIDWLLSNYSFFHLNI